MIQLTIQQKYAIVAILTQIMNADGVIHPKEEEFMDKIYVEFGIKIGDMEDITNMDEILAKSVINTMEDEKKEYAQTLFVSMAEADGYIHPLEIDVINQIWIKHE